MECTTHVFFNNIHCRYGQVMIFFQHFSLLVIFSQHSTLRLWPCDIRRVGPLRKRGEKQCREIHTYWNWFSLLDLLLRPDVFCLLLPYCVAVHAPTRRLRWKKMHLCSSRDHHNIRIVYICTCIEPRHTGGALYRIFVDHVRRRGASPKPPPLIVSQSRWESRSTCT